MVTTLPTLVLLSLVPGLMALQFLEEPTGAVVEFNKPFWLHCRAEHNGLEITYNWEHNARLLPLHENQVIYSNGTLYLRRVTYDDVGNYTCSARYNGVYIRSRSASLDIATISPTFNIHPVSRTVLLGDRVELVCEITSLPPANITWTLDGELVSQDTVNIGNNGESILVMDPVMYDQAGRYKCMATNSVNHVHRFSLEGKLTVQGQPVFLASLKAVSVPLGYTATFTCSYHGNPDPDITWYRHDLSDLGDVTSMRLNNSSKYAVYPNGTLQVYKATYEDEAFYTCTAGNVFGELSDSAKLNITGKAEAPLFIQVPQNVTVTKGDGASLYCDCGGKPDPLITWRKGQKEVPSDNGTLTIQSTQSTDTDWYTCVCANGEGSVNQSAFVDVQTHPSFPSLPPASQIVLKGEELTLDCVAEGNPTPTITWDTPSRGQSLTMADSTASVTLTSSGSLRVKVMTLADTGEYTCTASNHVGTALVSTLVRVEAPPVMTVRPVSQGVVVNQSVYLHCNASGVPSPVIKWSIDGRGDILSTIHTQVFMNHSLVVRDVAVSDSGVYRCTASNPHGQAQAVATVTVTVPPSFSVVPSNATVEVGESVALQCRADGEPVPDQWWTRDGRQLVLDDNMIMSVDKTGLVILAIQPGQFGQYSCQASNLGGTASVSAWVTEFDVPVFISPPQNMTVNQSASVTLTCTGSAREPPSTDWFKGQLGQAIQSQDAGGRVTVTGEGNLVIQGVLKSDEDWYTCVLRNSAGSVNQSAFIHVQVPPKITSTNTPQLTTVQSAVTLTCQSSGDPVPTYEWLTPIGQLATSTRVTHNTHTIQEVRQEDAGDWTCRACNLLGCDTAVVAIIIEGLPEIQGLTGERSGSQVILECSVAGQPPPAVTFTSGAQLVTSDTDSHAVEGNRLVIEGESVREEYTCVATNNQGTATRAVSVASETPAPKVLDKGSSWVTVQWTLPGSEGNLPLLQFVVQYSSNGGRSWTDAMTMPYSGGQGGRNLGQWEGNVTDLGAYTEYSFRVLTENVLGRGQGNASSSVQTVAGTPSPPTNVLGLEIKQGTILFMWDPPAKLNGPKGDIQFPYTVIEVREGRRLLLAQGVVNSNQTYQVEINGLGESTYKLSVWSHNTALNLSSEHVSFDLDMSSGVIVNPNSTPGQSTLPAEKIIAIIFGGLGGLILVAVVIFIILRVRHQRKSKSLSLVNHQLSLDQFYMENPRSLYDEDTKSSKRISRISFYSFDENFQSNRSLNKAGKGSPHRDSLIQTDVQLISRSPLQNNYDKQASLNKSISSLVEASTSTNGRKPAHRLSCTPQKSLESIPDTSAIEETDSKTFSVSNVKSSTPCSKALRSTKRPLSLPVETIRYEKYGEKEGESICEEYSKGDHSERRKSLTPLSAKDLEEDLSNIYGSVQEIQSVNGVNKSLEHIYSSVHSNSPVTSVPIPKSVPDDQSEHSNRSCDPKPPIRVISPAYLNGSKKTSQLSQSKTDKNSNYKYASNKVKDMDSRFPRETRSMSPKGEYLKDKLPVRVVSLEHVGDEGCYAKIEKGPIKKHCAFDGNCDLGLHFHCYGKRQSGASDEKDTDVRERLLNGNNVEDKNKKNKKNVVDDNFLSEEEIQLEVESAQLY
ncbi:hemicentin-1-like isoform X1 [Mya arenaria]|uniref:hemicentin-1-like isoform X1 n=1 Tax=Mya arenaria TaxID=6604 RepID=UPI0022E3A423|nr:hemicentin-1-like isoform X1 [Mya arenaria]XP_052789830.1 hemicentin-1-like isoform X1 [Mya arenaria]XP_052789832.1 hemicentin-1-like isoform X1 [Mya arenaria]XP_052789833.1 hemicentin-1-like isoform X1 [Mya arenaria]XP_052789834.1 hemicentin-1-like isoform X1 [Mya arenaria]XP_052789835.1 hemicentin-1-like isoform X1 [Mya arenaria]